MGKGSTPSRVKHSRTLDDGRIGCWYWSCGAPATRWIDVERFGIRRWLSTSYCDDHGDWELTLPDHTERKIKEARK
ncbi:MULTISPECIES: hypothetical protein [Streptomyces]|uniref:hypothetical protein n=1 Tax=Streptomyces TaxID=1883 RepID=UPI0036637096